MAEGAAGVHRAVRELYISLDKQLNTKDFQQNYSKWNLIPRLFGTNADKYTRWIAQRPRYFNSSSTRHARYLGAQYT
eukprot:9338023-Heterocapsa_arctica.AAC.1